jgi:integrase
VPHKRKAWLAKRVKLNGKWMSQPAERVKHINGIYVLTFWQHGNMVRKPVGSDLRKAITALNTQNLILNAKAAGIVAVEPEEKRHLLKTVVEEYLGHLRRRDLTPKTINGIENILTLFPQKYLEDLTLHAVAGEFVDKLRSEGYAKQTIYDRYAKVVSFLKWCERTYDVKRVCTLADGPGKPKKGAESGRSKDPYTDEQLEKLHRVSTLEEKLYWQFLLQTGAREREMTTCTWKDLDLEHRIFHVQAKPGFTPKNKSNRAIPIPQELVDALIHRKEHSKGELVFGKNGKVQRHLIRVLKARAVEAGFDPAEFYLHRFRHSFCNTHLRRGVDVATVSAWAGHADLATTALYLKAIKSKSAATKAMVDQVWSPIESCK